MEKTNPSKTSSASQKLHQEFVQLGRERNRLTYKLLNLLPEIYEKGVCGGRGCKTIEEYAGKYGGLSKFVVKKRLRLEKNLKDKPKLKEIIAQEGVHKVAIIAKIATPETDQFWADRVKNMSKEALFKVGKEIRSKEQFAAKEVQQVCRAADEKLNLELTGETMFLFLKLKKKLAADLSNNEAAKILLQKLDEILKSQEQAKRTAKSCPGATFKGSSEKTSNRHIPAAQKREILAQTDEKCAYPNCNKPYEILHHRDRFMDSKNHDSVIPLCKEHHEFMHNRFVSDETSPPETWKLKIEPAERPNIKTDTKADLLYRKYRQEALL